MCRNELDLACHANRLVVASCCGVRLGGQRSERDMGRCHAVHVTLPPIVLVSGLLSTDSNVAQGRTLMSLASRAASGGRPYRIAYAGGKPKRPRGFR